MKIFVDTNIFLDVLLDRAEAKSSAIVLNSVKEGLFDGVVLDITLLNIDYAAKKQTKNIKDFLALVNRHFAVVGADNALIAEALGIDGNDFEDCLQYVCAKKSKCDVIVSNDVNFYSGGLKVFGSSEFAAEYLA